MSHLRVYTWDNPHREARDDFHLRLYYVFGLTLTPLDLMGLKLLDLFVVANSRELYKKNSYVDLYQNSLMLVLAH